MIASRGLAQLVLVTVVSLCASAASAQTDPKLVAEFEAMKARLAEQDRQIAQLRAEVGHDWMNERRAEEVKTLVREVLADAKTRASLMDSQLTAGWKNGFYLASADGNNLLKIKGMLQFRHVAGFQNDTAETHGDDARAGFEISRARFGFMGHVVDPTWQYVIWTGYTAFGDNAFLDAYVKKDLGGGWSVIAGQFKLPFEREYLVSETRQQFVERSLLCYDTGCTYAQGVMLDYQNDAFHLAGSYTDGCGTTNSPWNTYDTEWGAVTLRGEWKVLGDWKDYADFEGWPDSGRLFVVGGAVHVQDGERGGSTVPAAASNEVDEVRWTADAHYEFSRGNLYAAIVGVHQNADDVDETDKIGFLVQGGYFVNDQVELMGRYEYGDPDADDDKLSVLTVGANYFVKGHAAKLTMDLGYAFTPVGPTWAASGAGYQTDSSGEAGQVVWRTQMQLLF